MPSMALLKLTHLYFALQLTSITDELSYNADHGEVHARPSQACGGAGEPGEEQGAHEQQGFGRLLIPPAKK